MKVLCGLRMSLTAASRLVAQAAKAGLYSLVMATPGIRILPVHTIDRTVVENYAT